MTDSSIAPITRSRTRVVTLCDESQSTLCVLVTAGEFDIGTDSLLRDALTRALDSGPRVVVVDLSAVTFLGLSSVAVLCRAQARAEDEVVALRVVECPAPIVRRCLDAVGMAEQFTFYPSLAAAIAGPPRPVPGQRHA